jgi:hypothetical protein
MNNSEDHNNNNNSRTKTVVTHLTLHKAVRHDSRQFVFTNS